MSDLQIRPSYKSGVYFAYGSAPCFIQYYSSSLHQLACDRPRTEVDSRALISM